MGMRIEEGNRKFLHLHHQRGTDAEENLLGQIDHDFVVEDGTEDTADIDTDDGDDILYEDAPVLRKECGGVRRSTD